MANNNDEPRIQLGKYENGVLEIREGFKKLDDESMEGYEHVRKVIFPASLEKLEEDVFSETKELEELDFSRVTKLKEIPGDLVSCKTKITTFVIPQGVKEVGDGFLSEAKKGTKIFVPASVKQMGYINGNDDNDLEVYLFASGIDIDDFEADVNTLYVLPQDYADYAEKLKDRESEAKLREIPEELVNFYSNIASTAASATQPAPVAQPAPAAVMSAPTPPPTPAAPKVDNQPAAPVASAVQQNASQQQTTNTKNMPKQLIPEELNELIQEYLTDGVLTDKERQVILRKAEGMGLDRDEIDLYLDAQVQKIDQATDAAARKQKGKQCPYCGGSVPQLTDKCPHCGENITAEASSELQDIFDNLEEALVDFKAGKDIAKSKATVERFMRKAKMYYGNNPKIQKLLEEVETESLKAEKAAKSNARKNTVVKILTYNWKITAAVVLAIVVGIFMLFHKSSDEVIEESAKNLSAQINNYLKDGNLDEAKNYLMDFVVPSEVREHGTSMIVDKYDAVYLKVIKAYIKDGNYDDAEELAIAYRGKIGNELSWAKAPIYIYLRSEYEKSGRDFSALLSSDDFISR